MIRFIKRFISAWRFAALETKFLENFDHPEAWDKTDTIQTKQFVNTPAGLKLNQRMVNLVYKMAISATEWPNEAKYHVGVARGVAMTVKFFQEHFTAPILVK